MIRSNGVQKEMVSKRARWHWLLLMWPRGLVLLSAFCRREAWRRARTRPLPLRGFPKLVVAALWTGKLPPIAESFLELLRAEARTLRDS